jgi:hypothetical protein
MGVLDLVQTWDHIHPFLCNRGSQDYTRGQFVETPWQFIKNATKLGLLMQMDSQITQQFSLRKSVISEISDTTFL